MFDWAKIVKDLLNLAPRYCVAAFLMTGFLLFSPSAWLDIIDLANFANNHRVVLGLIFLCCAFIILWDATKVGGRILWVWIMQKRIRKKGIHRLKCLTEDEKQILRFYIWNETKSNTLRLDDGVVKGLETAGIIYRSSGFGNMLEGFPYNINEFAWQYLHKHKELLVGGTDAQRTDKRRTLFRY